VADRIVLGIFKKTFRFRSRAAISAKSSIVVAAVSWHFNVARLPIRLERTTIRLTGTVTQ
jgi:hypothetical protein